MSCHHFLGLSYTAPKPTKSPRPPPFHKRLVLHLPVPVRVQRQDRPLQLLVAQPAPQLRAHRRQIRRGHAPPAVDVQPVELGPDELLVLHQMAPELVQAPLDRQAKPDVRGAEQREARGEGGVEGDESDGGGGRLVGVVAGGGVREPEGKHGGGQEVERAAAPEEGEELQVLPAALLQGGRAQERAAFQQEGGDAEQRPEGVEEEAGEDGVGSGGVALVVARPEAVQRLAEAVGVVREEADARDPAEGAGPGGAVGGPGLLKGVGVGFMDIV